MKNLALSLLVAATLGAAAGSALAQPGSIDTNNDGKLSLPEFLAGRAVPMMRRMDANKDGKITQAEMQSAMPAGGPGGAGGAERPNRPRGGGGFMTRMDTNKDGAISKAELDAAQTTQFKAADADHNGFLSLTEFQSMRGPGSGGGRRGQDDGQQ
jgi:hypothetical protein